MELKEVAPDIFCLKVSLDLSEDSVNLYILRGKVPTLIDSGTKSPQVYEVIQDALKELEISRLEQVLLTHWHVDHAGGAESLRKDGAKIYIGKRDYNEWVEFCNGNSFKVFEEFAGKVWGVPEEQLATIIQSNKWLLKYTELPEEVVKLDIGAVLPAGNGTLKAIYTPGHTSGHFSYYEENQGLLFSGDFLLPDVVPYPGAWLENGKVVSGLPSYLLALNRVEFLGARQYFPAHGKARTSPAVRCSELRSQIMRQAEYHKRQGTVYEASLELSRGRFNPVASFVQMHYVFGWNSIKPSAPVQELVG